MTQIVLLSVFLLLNFNVKAENTMIPSIQSRIVGGDITSTNSALYAVAILSNNKYFCVGSIISVRYIITVAQPFYKKEHMKYKVRLRSSFYMMYGLVYPVHRLIPHPKSNVLTYDYDYLILELFHCIKFSKLVYQLPIRIPKKNFKVRDNQLLIVSGFGDTGSSTEPSVRLRSVLLTKANQKWCKLVYRPYKNITSRMFCVGGGKAGTGPCTGDNGAPVVYNKVLLGMASFGRDCAKEGFPAVFSKISAVSKWIKSVIKA